MVTSSAVVGRRRSEASVRTTRHRDHHALLMRRISAGTSPAGVRVGMPTRQQFSARCQAARLERPRCLIIGSRGLADAEKGFSEHRVWTSRRFLRARCSSGRLDAAGRALPEDAAAALGVVGQKVSTDMAVTLLPEPDSRQRAVGSRHSKRPRTASARWPAQCERDLEVMDAQAESTVGGSHRVTPCFACGRATSERPEGCTETPCLHCGPSPFGTACGGSFKPRSWGRGVAQGVGHSEKAVDEGRQEDGGRDELPKWRG